MSKLSQLRAMRRQVERFVVTSQSNDEPPTVPILYIIPEGVDECPQINEEMLTPYFEAGTNFYSQILVEEGIADDFTLPYGTIAVYQHEGQWVCNMSNFEPLPQ